MTIINETTLKAAEGKVLTNGFAFGTTIYLGKNDNKNNWYEVTEEEAERLQQTEPAENEATIEDYIAALAKLGVE